MASVCIIEWGSAGLKYIRHAHHSSMWNPEPANPSIFSCSLDFIILRLELMSEPIRHEFVMAEIKYFPQK